MDIPQLKPQINLPVRSYHTIWLDLSVIVITEVIAFLLISLTDVPGNLITDASQGSWVSLEKLAFMQFATSMVLAVLWVLRWQQLHEMADKHDGVIEQLNGDRLLLRTLIDLLPDYIFAKDMDGKYILSNIAHARAAKTENPDDLIGKLAFDVFPSELARQYDIDDHNVMATGIAVINASRETVDGEGKKRIVLTNKMPIRNHIGNIIGLVGISRDVTQLQKEILETLESALELERVKMMTSFTQDVAHDFRTPMTTIATSVYLLERATTPEKRHHHAEVINQQIQRLEQLLQGLTTMARLDSVYELPLKPLSLNRLLSSIMRISDTIYADKQLELKLDLSHSLPLIHGAEDELYQAFHNLFMNALQYTLADGKVQVTSSQQDDRLVVEIRDTGIGIAEADLMHISDRFFRVDRARSLNTGGIGLGLTVAKKIIELHAGTLTLTSVVGEGTTVQVSLPIPTTPDVEAIPVDALVNGSV